MKERLAIKGAFAEERNLISGSMKSFRMLLRRYEVFLGMVMRYENICHLQ